MALFLSGHFPQITFSLFPAVFLVVLPRHFITKAANDSRTWDGGGGGLSSGGRRLLVPFFMVKGSATQKRGGVDRRRGSHLHLNCPLIHWRDILNGKIDHPRLTTLPTAENMFLRTKPYATAFIFKNKVEPCHAMHGRFRSPLPLPPSFSRSSWQQRPFSSPRVSPCPDFIHFLSV